MPIQMKFGDIDKGFEDLSHGIERVRGIIKTIVLGIGEFKLLDDALVPYGLKPIARSISWLIEQIVVQNMKKQKGKLDIMDVIDPPHGLQQYDCVIRIRNDDRDYYINVKTSLAITDKSGRFDISKADKLIKLYDEIRDLVLLVAIVVVDMRGVNIKFKDVTVFNVAWVPSIYYNRANHNLQSTANGTQVPRSNEDFLRELRKLLRQAGHSEHY